MQSIKIFLLFSRVILLPASLTPPITSTTLFQQLYFLDCSTSCSLPTGEQRLCTPPFPSHKKPSNGYECNENKTQISQLDLWHSQWPSSTGRTNSPRKLWEAFLAVTIIGGLWLRLRGRGKVPKCPVVYGKVPHQQTFSYTYILWDQPFTDVHV